MNRPPRIRIAIPRLAPALLLGALAVSPPLAAEEVSKLAGQWSWTWKDPAGTTHRHELDVEGIDTKLAARERFDDEPAVKVEKLKLDGKKVGFAVVRGKKRAEYSGTLDGDTINGTVVVTEGDPDKESDEFVWKATRDKPKGEPAPKP